MYTAQRMRPFKLKFALRDRKMIHFASIWCAGGGPSFSRSQISNYIQRFLGRPCKSIEPLQKAINNFYKSPAVEIH